MRTIEPHKAIALIAFVFAAFTTGAACGAIPASERAALLSLYASTNGGTWSRGSTSWNGPAGTECTWVGIQCDAGGTTVTEIQLSANNLTGSLPGNLNDLTNLRRFEVASNLIAGAIPALTGLTKLEVLNVEDNRLTGSIPALTGLSSLTTIYVFNNQLTGTIPELAGLTELDDFVAHANQLSGPIPALAGLTKLVEFSVEDNQLTGAIPALAGLTKLQFFIASRNQLVGPIPELADLTSLHNFAVQDNHIVGPIPSLTGLTKLQYFYAQNNNLTGSTPALTGLTNLQFFLVANNQLDGSIGALAGVTNLLAFDASNNRLTGFIPMLNGLGRLGAFEVGGNQLVGDAPAVPAPNSLAKGQSSLCPNRLNHVTDVAWDTATGQSPWYTLCTSAGIPNPPSGATPNYQGLWWNASESGWGVNLAHQGNRIFATWYTYDTGGTAFWLSMLATQTTPSGGVYVGDVYSDIGPPFNSFVGSASANKVGTGSLTFTGVDAGSFSYSVSAGGASNVTQTKAITRFVLDPGTSRPICAYSSAPDLAGAANYQDLWWTPSEPGWGINLAHQGNQIYATWYTFAPKTAGNANPPIWLSGLLTRENVMYDVFQGPLTSTSGPRFDAYAPPFTTQRIGDGQLVFVDGNHATFTYQTSGIGSWPDVRQTKLITRFLFAPTGGTTCQ